MSSYTKRERCILFCSLAVGIVIGFLSAQVFSFDGFSTTFFTRGEGDEKTSFTNEATSRGSSGQENVSLVGASFEFPIPVSGENILVVAHQPAGEAVIMSMVSLTVKGWVAIHEKNAEGNAGVILGARRFDVGNHFAESIPLLRATREGRAYVALLHGDDGDSEFDFVKETPLLDTAGKLIDEEFLAVSGGD